MAIYKGGLDIALSLRHDNDPRNFNLDRLGGAFPYVPKSKTRVLLPTLEIKNQKQINSCVCEGTAVQAETIETNTDKVELSAGDLGAYLVSQGLMNENGTSIQGAIKALIARGIAEESLVPTDHNSFYTFSAPGQLTIQGEKANAAKHKGKSFWSTRGLDAVLQRADMKQLGQTGCMWYSGYNTPDASGILEPNKGYQVYGHDLVIRGYDPDYQGEKVVILQNHYSATWGDQGLCYVRFADWDKIITFSSYYVLPLERNLAQWLHDHADNAIHKLDDDKIYLIEGNERRHIHDEAIFWMLGLNFKDVHVDKDNVLDQIKEGPEITIDDIPKEEIERFKETLKALRNTIDVKRIFSPYFSEADLNLN